MYYADQSPSPRPIIAPLGALYERVAPLSYPLIRATAGLLLLPHGAQKLFGMFGGDIGATAGFFAKVGIQPALPFAYLFGGIEFVGGLLLAIGLLTRVAAAGVVIMMAVAVLQVHLGNGFFWTKGGFEYPLFWGLVAFAIFLRGGGEMSVDRAIGREL
jgi:putative oxidoreductase